MAPPRGVLLGSASLLYRRLTALPLRAPATAALTATKRVVPPCSSPAPRLPCRPGAPPPPPWFAPAAARGTPPWWQRCKQPLMAGRGHDGDGKGSTMGAGTATTPATYKTSCSPTSSASSTKASSWVIQSMLDGPPCFNPVSNQPMDLFASISDCLWPSSSHVNSRANMCQVVFVSVYIGSAVFPLGYYLRRLRWWRLELGELGNLGG